MKKVFMNYISLHDKFIQYFKSTSVIDRLRSRNINDRRIYDSYIYTERHHIIPQSQGGTNEISNLVDLLPEEHIFIHFLRFKAFHKAKDLQAVKFCLNGQHR